MQTDVLLYQLPLQIERVNPRPVRGALHSERSVFDALISRRPYKESFPLEKALQMLKEDSGIFFDPALVDVFAKMAGSLHAEIGEADDMVLEKKLNGLLN